MSDAVFNFIFSRTRHVKSGAVCRNITLNRKMVEQILAGLAGDAQVKDYLADPSTFDGLRDDLTDFLLMPEPELSADNCFQACMAVLLLAMTIGKVAELMEYVGVLCWFDREEDTPLDTPIKMYVQGYTAEQVAEVVAAMAELGSEYRDLGAETRTTLMTERRGATLH
jgi:hypothetical protein